MNPKTKRLSVFSPDYGLQTMEYNGETKLNFVFINSKYNQPIDEETIDLGLGKIVNRKMTQETSNTDFAKDQSNTTFTNIYDMIKVKVPNVLVIGTRIIIRDTNTLNNSTNTDPLFVVNGSVVSRIYNIQPNQVKSIRVLKGSAASMYGSRGANGVLLITLM